MIMTWYALIEKVNKESGRRNLNARFLHRVSINQAYVRGREWPRISERYIRWESVRYGHWELKRMRRDGLID